MKIIAGKHRKRKLKSPKSDLTRPSSSFLRETLFNICQWEIEDACFLDLFAGSGAVGLEALSRGAREVTFIEEARAALSVLRENIALLNEEEHARIMPLEAFKGLEKLKEQKAHFTLIFADPPYGKGLSNQVLVFIDQFPDLLENEGSLFLEDEIEKESGLELKHLKLESIRRIGNANLRHFRKIYPTMPD